MSEGKEATAGEERSRQWWCIVCVCALCVYSVCVCVSVSVVYARPYSVRTIVISRTAMLITTKYVMGTECARLKRYSFHRHSMRVSTAIATELDALRVQRR